MAVSGRKGSEFLSIASLKSAEDFDHGCEPCNSTGEHVEAYGFCVDCQEYLCKTCYTWHKKTKVLRNHHLLDKGNFDEKLITSKDSEECIEKCSVHRNEIIKFFCPTHKALGCHDCMTLGHRVCKIDYIPDKCKAVRNSDEYKDTVRKLDEKIEEVGDVIKKAEIREKEIDKCHADVIKEILNFRKEINDRLDQLQDEIQKEADRKKTNDKQIIKMVLDECANISSDIEKLKLNLQTYRSSNQDMQLFICIKQTEDKLESDKVEKAVKNLEKTDMQYSFQQNIDLKNVMARQDIFGKLNISANLVTPMMRKALRYMTHKEDIPVKSPHSCVTGCDVLPPTKIVFSDTRNFILTVVDIESKTAKDKLVLDTKPWDIAALPNDEIAVTMVGKKEIFLMKTAGHLSVVKKISVIGECTGITYHQDSLYVLCMKPKSVLVMDTQGNVKNIILLKNEVFQCSQYIAVSEDSTLIYISDFCSESVVSITLQGDVSAVYKHKDLSGPSGILLLEDGSLLVCCYSNSTVHHVTADLKQGRTIDSLQWPPQSICYSHRHDEIYVGCTEKPFPTYIGIYPTDVLEGCFTPFNCGPNDYHEHVKMGLAIHANVKNSKGKLLAGTLGGFFDHPLYGLCGLTCAHVLLSGEEMESLKSRHGIDFTKNPKHVFQPVDHRGHQFGQVLSAIYTEGGNSTSGMEVAIFNIFDRLPVDGSFPESRNYEEIGFDDSNPMEYNTGKVCKVSNIRRRSEVYKYGITTEATRGSLGFRGTVVRTTEISGRSQTLEYRLYNQIEVLRIDEKPFALPGDSGALVFFDDNSGDTVAVGIVEGGQNNGKVFVTPICDILRSFNCFAMKSFYPLNSTSRDPEVNMDCDNVESMEI